MTSFYFDTREFTPETPEYTPIPDKTKIEKAMIIAIEEKVGSSNVPYERLTVEVLEGPYKGRKVSENLYLNGSPTAQSIAYNKLYDIAKANNMVTIESRDSLKNKQVGVMVGCDSNGYNNIKRFYRATEPSYAATAQADYAEPAVAGRAPF